MFCRCSLLKVYKEKKMFLGATVCNIQQKKSHSFFRVLYRIRYKKNRNVFQKQLDLKNKYYRANHNLLFGQCHIFVVIQTKIINKLYYMTCKITYPFIESGSIHWTCGHIMDWTNIFYFSHQLVCKILTSL